MSPDHLDIVTPLVFVIFFFKLNEVQTETMHKFNTTQQKLYVSCCLITSQQNGGKGGGVYLKFSPLGGALIQRGPLF